ncbi:MAG TPA: response regulator [Desulfobacterales bacterium]
MHKIRVLVVDDEADFRETMIKRLTRRDIEADEAESGEKALEMIDKRLYDVIILDLKMEGMDGIAALREIKNVKPLVEVILLTGHGSVESGIEGMKLGAFDYILKPAHFDTLMEKITEAHGKKNAHEEKIRQAIVRDLSAHPSHVMEIIKKEKK